MPDDVRRIRDGAHRFDWWIAEAFFLRNFRDLSEMYFKDRVRHLYLDSVSAAKKSQAILPDTGKSWRFARWKDRFWYAYENISPKYRKQIPHPEVLKEMAKLTVKSDRLESLERLVKQGLTRIQKVYWRGYAGFPQQHILELGRACAALDLCISMGAERGELDAPNAQWYRDFAEVLDRLDVRYVPLNWRLLKERVTEVRGGAKVEDVISLPRAGNQNARKLDDEELVSWIVQMRGMPQNFTHAHIVRKCRQMCQITGKPVPSDSWFAGQLAAPTTKFLTSAGRYGERGMRGQVYRGYTPVANAIFAGDAWQADGTRVNMVPWKDANGREQYLYMVVIRDVHSGAVLGEHYCLHEDRWAYLNALRMAVNTAGHLPHALLLDRFPGHNTPEWQTVEQRLTMFGVDVSYKHTAQGKAQLERWFETLQSVFFQESPYYYGEGIKSTRQAAHRSAEYVRAVRKVANGQGWGFDAAVREASGCIAAYNRTALNTYSRKFSGIDKSPAELWAASEKPHIHTLDPFQGVLLFGFVKRVSIRNLMIRTEIERAEFVYPIEDYEVLRNHSRVLLGYFLEDPSRAWLFADDDSRPVNPPALCEVQAMERVQVFGPDADYKGLGKNQKRINEIRARRDDELAGYRAGGDVALRLNGMGGKSEAEAAETSALEELYGGNVPRLMGAAAPDEYKEAHPDEGEEFDVEGWVLSQM